MNWLRTHNPPQLIIHDIIKAGIMRKLTVAKIFLNFIVSFAAVDNYRPDTIKNNIKKRVHSYIMTYSNKLIMI